MTSKAPKPSPDRKTASRRGADELQCAGQASPNQPDCDPHNNTLAVSTNHGGIKLLEQQVHESELHVSWYLLGISPFKGLLGGVKQLGTFQGYQHFPYDSYTKTKVKTIWSPDESTRRSQNRLRKMVGCLFSSAQPPKNVHVLLGSQKCSIYVYIYICIYMYICVF